MENYENLMGVNDIPHFKNNCLLIYHICTQIKQILSQPASDTPLKKVKGERAHKDSKVIYLEPQHYKDQIARLKLDKDFQEALYQQVNSLPN